MTHFPKPPSTWLQIAPRTRPTLLPINIPFLEEPSVPHSILLGWRSMCCWAAGLHPLISLSVCHKNVFFYSFFSEGSWLVTGGSAATFYHMPQWCRAPCLKAVQGKRVRDFHAFSSSGLSRSRVIIHSRQHVRDDAPMTFPPPTPKSPHQPATYSRFVVAESKQKGLSEPNICCFLPEPQQPSVTISPQLRKYLNGATGLCPPQLTPPLPPIYRHSGESNKCEAEGRMETYAEGNVEARLQFSKSSWELNWMAVLRWQGVKKSRGLKKMEISFHVPKCPQKSHVVASHIHPSMYLFFVKWQLW